jgi:hypothetical protein
MSNLKPSSEAKNINLNKFSRSYSNFALDPYQNPTTSINVKTDLTKHESQCVVSDYSKESYKENVVNTPKRKNNNIDTPNTRHRRKSVGDIMCEQNHSGGSSSNSPKVRVSSGSFFYGQVIAKQKLNLIPDSIKKVKHVEKYYTDSEIRSKVSYGIPTFYFFKKLDTPAILCIFFCQLCVNANLYYLIWTRDCQICSSLR